MGIAAVVGLGNPGAEYAATRHNVGFLVIDELARRFRLTEWRSRYHAQIARRAGGAGVILVKPRTFMNCSGDALVALCQGERLPTSQCLVVVDDVDLPLGQIRVRERGGPGSHNGLRSVVAEIGEEFPRLRLGIRGAAPWDDLADYVLAPFDTAELEAVTRMVARAVDCVETALRVGLGRAASRFNAPEERGTGEEETGTGERGPGTRKEGPGTGERDA